MSLIVERNLLFFYSWLKVERDLSRRGWACVVDYALHVLSMCDLYTICLWQLFCCFVCIYFFPLLRLQGYGSFLLRDLPFDAIQFCLYEQLRIGYKAAVSSSQHIIQCLDTFWKNLFYLMMFFISLFDCAAC